MEVKVGQEITTDGVHWYRVKEIKEDKIPTMRKGEIIFYRLYLEGSYPVYRHNIKGVRDGQK